MRMTRLSPSKRGEPRGRLRLEIGKDVVLDDDHIAACRGIQQLMRDRRRKGRARRVVDCRIRDVEPWPFGSDDGSEGRAIRAGGRIGDADDLYLMQTAHRHNVLLNLLSISLLLFYKPF